jgi:hypothetical protein
VSVRHHWVSTRHPYVPIRASLVWEAESELHRAPARLVSLTPGRASLITDDPPPMYRSVCVRLERPVPTNWATAHAVRRDGTNLVDLSFVGPCPSDFYRAAVAVT